LWQSRISQIESGTRSAKDTERGFIARALGMTEAELFGDIGYSGEAVALTGGAWKPAKTKRSPGAHAMGGGSATATVTHGRRSRKGLHAAS
jgi:hypothetical protein